MQSTVAPVTEAEIWTRIIMPEKDSLSLESVCALLELTFTEVDKARMNELARRNREGAFTDEERKELALYVKVGDLLSLLHLKARKSLVRRCGPRL